MKSLDGLRLNPRPYFISPENFSDFGVYNYDHDEILLTKTLIEDLSAKKEIKFEYLEETKYLSRNE